MVGGRKFAGDWLLVSLDQAPCVVSLLPRSDRLQSGSAEMIMQFAGKTLGPASAGEIGSVVNLLLSNDSTPKTRRSPVKAPAATRETIANLFTTSFDAQVHWENWPAYKCCRRPRGLLAVLGPPDKSRYTKLLTFVHA